MKTVPEVIEQIGNWHIQYCVMLERSLTAPAKGWKRPSAELFLGRKAQRRCGYYNRRKHNCAYSLCYALVEKQQFNDTVAHEVAHAYTAQIMPKHQWHGDLWKYVFRVLLGFSDSGRQSKSGKRLQAMQLYKLLMHRKDFHRVEIPLQSVDTKSSSAVAAKICAPKT